ncbi:MAG: sulfotransferase [Lentisphaeria bacterium]|nr:sulfotransferase [Lentisphaeria bacterium]
MNIASISRKFRQKRKKLRKFLKIGKRQSAAALVQFCKVIRPHKPPVFIVGCGHSGTSILLAILGAHPSIHPIPKETFIGKKTKSRFNELVTNFEFLTIKARKRRWIEKTPGNIRYLSPIFERLPDAKVIIIIRDGRDVAASIQKRTGNLENGIKRWCNDNLAGKEYWDNPNVYRIKYEDIISDFEKTITDLLSFLDEKYYDDLKNYHKTPKKWYSNKISKPESASKKKPQATS